MTSSRGKVVVITGGSSGIGLATARMLADRGAHLVLGARRADRLEQSASSIREAGGSVVSRQTDVARLEDLRALVDLAVASFGRLDILVSNAGVMPVSRIDALRVDDWDAMVDTHVKGLLNGIAAAMPIFQQQGSGHFISTSSVAGLHPSPAMAVYAGTKAAVRVINEGLRQEAVPGVRVTTVSPGFTATNFGASITDDDLRDRLVSTAAQIAVPASAIASAMVFAIEQPEGVDVNEIVVRPTAQR